MDKFIRKTRGAISIFLVIVLLPILSVASLFVDMSRINLANSMAESAGDLTLNTALTNYDTELKTLYGLFATSQDMDELMVNLEDYYRDSIVAAGVDSAAADDYVGQIMDYLKSTTGTDDLMNIALSGFEVSAPTGGNLRNPAILKSQVVEFMKYRAPLNLGTGFLEALSSMKNLSKQTTAVEKKTAFYEKHQSLTKTLEEIWWQLELYQYADAKESIGFPTGNYITGQADIMTANAGLWDSQNIVKDMVELLYRRSSFDYIDARDYRITQQFVCPSCSKANDYDKSVCGGCHETLDKSWEYEKWELIWQGEKKTVRKTFTEDDPATPDEVLSSLNTVLNAVKTVQQYSTGDYKKGYEAANMQANGDAVKGVYSVCIFNEEIAKSGNYLKAVKAFLESLVTLKSALNTCDPEELSKVKVTYIDSTGNYKVETTSGGTPLANMASNNLTSHLTMKSGGHLDLFNQTISRVAANYLDAESAFNIALKGDDKHASVTKRIDAIRDQAANYDAKLATKIDNLGSAITKLGDVKKKITDPTSDYYKAMEEWKTSATNLGDDTMGKNDLAEIENLKSVVTADRIDDLVTRLTAAKTTLEAVQTEIAKYKFAGKSWKDITDNISVDDAIALLSTWDEEIKKVDVKANGSGAYGTVINKIEGTVEKGTIKNTWKETDSSPNLVHQQRDLYSWLHNNFYKKGRSYDNPKATPNETGSASTTDIEGTLKNQADEQNPAAESSQKSTEVNREVVVYYECPSCKELNKSGTKKCTSCDTKMEETSKYASSSLPSTSWDKTAAAIAEGSIQTDSDKALSENKNLLAELAELASDLGAGLRDDLYVSEYIMTMFSYDTIEKEMYVKEKGKEGDYKPFWTADDAGNFTENKDMLPYSSKVQTLTNNAMNPGMNYLYRGEVEYILYGDNGTTKVYATIFGIRFALNTVYAFMDAEINNTTLSAATALFGTPPLTPLIPVAKVAMTIGIAIAESAWDLVELREGKEIPLMKSKETWVMSPSGLASAVKDKAEQVVKDAALEVVDKGIDAGQKFLSEAIDMTAEELNAYISETEDGLKNLSDSAISSISDSLKNSANDAIQKVVELCNSANQQAMMSAKYTGMGANSIEDEKVKQVVAGLNNWLAEQASNDPAVLEAKRVAVNYLTENGGTRIVTIYNKIATQCSETNADTTVLDNYLKELESNVGDAVNSAITTAGNALHGYVDKARTELQGKLEEAAKKGGEELKNVLNDNISKAFGSVPVKEGGEVPKAASTNSVFTSLLSWSYSDYLRIFVVLGLISGNDEIMMLRMADMIELSMQNKDGTFAVVTSTETKTVTKSRFFGLFKSTSTEEVETNKLNQKAFSLGKSNTYLTIKATLEVKPLLMTMPFMADTVEKKELGTKWYEITYTGTLGY